MVSYKHDIFPSFRGLDVRRGLVSHLYNALTDAGIRAFLDTHNVKKGQDIASSLHGAIEASHVLMPIFSSNYAQSPWCMREASLIARKAVVQREGKGSAIVIPLFYDVTPRQVRYPTKSGSPYCQAFHQHETSGIYKAEEIEVWKAALFEICRLSGWSLPEDFNGYEGAMVKHVVQEVARLCG